eukprot:12726410-Heterocapsa_arctica.AAC.1
MCWTHPGFEDKAMTAVYGSNWRDDITLWGTPLEPLANRQAHRDRLANAEDRTLPRPQRSATPGTVAPTVVAA